MFEQVYLRKPPGMPWAVALFSVVLGETEFAARAVSAFATTMSAVLVCFAGCRWFGAKYGAIAGVGLVLMPLFWYPGRSSEIEALHNMWVLGAMLAMLAFGLAAPGRRWWLAIGGGMCITGMLMTKGPAGLPCLAAAILACRVARGSWGSVFSPAAAWFIAIPAVMVGGFVFIAWRHFTGLHETAIVEPPGRFLWNPAKIPAIATLPLVALLSALPQGLAVPLAFAAPVLDARREGYARGILLTCVFALLMYALVGVANPRYVMPALSLAPLACAVLAARWCEGSGRRDFGIASKRLGRGSAVIAILLLAAAIGHSYWLEQRREYRTSGRRAGISLGEILRDGSEVWAFEMIDHRPELLYYARLRAAELGKIVRVRWVPVPVALMQPGPPRLPPTGGYLVLRDDEGRRDQYPPELPEYENADLLRRLGTPVFRGAVHNFTFRVYQIP